MAYMQGFTPRGAGGGGGARASGPQTAIIQQDTPTKMRRVAATTDRAVYNRDGVQTGKWTGGNQITYDPGGTGGGIYNGPRRLVPVEIGTPLVMRRSNVSVLGEYGDEYLGFSLGKIVSNIGKTVKKAVVDTGHAVGTAVTSKVGQGLLGTALAVTGVGAPVAAGIFAATKGVGTLIKPGGNLKGAVTGAAQGAVEGVVAATAGKLVRAGISKITQSHASTGATATNAASGGLATAAAGVVGAAAPAVVTTMMSGGKQVNMETLEVPPLALPIPSAPQNDGLRPLVPKQPTPLFPKQKRVAADVNPKVNVAKKVLAGGKMVNQKAGAGADKVDALSKKLDTLADAMGAAKAIGDQAGIDQLSQVAAGIQQQIANAQNIAGGVSSDMRMAGNIAEGAAGGAVAGAGFSSLGQFITDHKPLVYGTLGGAALLITLAMVKPTRGNSNGGRARRRRA